MTKRERVYASIRRQPADAIPWQFDLTGAVVDRLKAYLKTDDISAALDDHFCYVRMPEPKSVIQGPLPEGCYRNPFGAVWRRESSDRSIGDWGGLVSYPIHEPTLQGYHFPDPLAEPMRNRHLGEFRKKYPDHFLWTAGGSLFETAWAMCGFENYLSYIAGEETFVEELTDKITDYFCKEITFFKSSGIDAARVGDDWGFQGSLMIQPTVWRRIYKKYYRRLFQAIHDAGLIAMMHSCGSIEELIPDLIEIGLDVLHPLQPEANDVTRCQREFGRNITFWGALGSQSTLPRGTTEDVRREVKERLKLFRGGGYVLAPAGAAPTETPVENIMAIVHEARSQLTKS